MATFSPREASISAAEHRFVRGVKQKFLERARTWPDSVKFT